MKNTKPQMGKGTSSRSLKVFISADMEGATGIVHGEQIMVKGDDYARGRELLTGDVNAAVEGAVAAGATEVVICEGHATMRVILIEKLHPKARLICGPASSKDLCQVEGIDATFGAAMFIAYHAKAGTPGAILPHTWLGRVIHKARVNGREVGETGINAAILGCYGVPVVLVTGDRALCAEARETLGSVATVEVKHAYGRAAASCLPPSATGPMIREAARAAVERRGRVPVSKVGRPASMEIAFHQTAMAEKALQWQGARTKEEFQRAGEREVKIAGNDFIAVVKQTWRMLEFVASEQADWLR